MNTYYVYMLATWDNKVLYIGVTNDLKRRVFEHKNKLIDGFTKKYNLKKLVYFEELKQAKDAIAREKELKDWTRAKKNTLVSNLNPNWRDLSIDFDIFSL